MMVKSSAFSLLVSMLSNVLLNNVTRLSGVVKMLRKLRVIEVKKEVRRYPLVLETGLSVLAL